MAERPKLHLRAETLIPASDMRLVAAAGDSGLGAALQRATRAFREQHFDRMVREPKLNCERMVDDWRYQFGVWIGLHFLDELIAAAGSVDETSRNKG
jgi:hypothetical protein